MIFTLLITIVVEGILAFVYSIWQKKPARPILYTSLVANLITQSFLWVVLSLFFQHYLISLFLAEIFIWFVESVTLYSIPANRLGLQEAIYLSLLMNLASLSVGWILPI